MQTAQLGSTSRVNMQPRRGLRTGDPSWPPLQSVSCWKSRPLRCSELTKGSARMLEPNSRSLSFIVLYEVLRVFSWLSANAPTAHPIEQLPLLSCVQVAGDSLLLFRAEH